MGTIATSSVQNSQLEALWTLILNQERDVQLSLSARLNLLLNSNAISKNSDSVFNDEFEVYASVTKALMELREAQKTKKTLPDAFDLVAELENDDQ